MKQTPSQLLQDNDGHWYLVPEAKIVKFESALALNPDADEGWEAFNEFEQYRVDGPHRVRILAWEEMN